MDLMEFYFGYDAKEGVEEISTFVLIGEVVFKGFETKPPTVVYEMLDADAPLFKSIRKRHFGAWLEEAKKKKGDGLLES